MEAESVLQNCVIGDVLIFILLQPLPQNKNKWVHPVIFEPQPMVQLTWSSYKVTSFLDFQPFLDGFKAI